MSRRQFIGLSSAVTIALGVGAALYVAPGVAVSNPAEAGAVAGTFSDPAPRRTKVAQAQTDGGSALPGGASLLNETYKDWAVTCVQQGTTKQCAMSQVQTRQNGQRVLALELSAPSGNTISGTLVMPFGLALDSGVMFQIDDMPAMKPIPFRTCLPGGCLVNVSLDAATLVALRAGAFLKINAVADGGVATPFSVSLQGFGTALDRVAALAR